jgi:hypothetical protein
MLSFLLEDFNVKNLNKRKDKHFDNLSALLKNAIVSRGFDVYEQKSIQTESYSKKFDVYSERTGRKHVIELKSISSSFGKNFNNRVEEMVGQAWLFKNMLKIDKVGYVFVYHDIEEKYSHYDRLKAIMDECVVGGLLDSCLLIKLSGKDIHLDPGCDVEKFLYNTLN